MIMAVLALTLTANAQKFGYVNTQELFMLMPELKDVQARMDSLNIILNATAPANNLSDCTTGRRAEAYRVAQTGKRANG